MFAYIFGAGKNGEIFYQTIKEYFKGVEIIAFIDNDEKKQGIKIFDRDCISISKAIEEGAQNEVILVTPNKAFEIMKELEKKNFKRIICVSHLINRMKYYIPHVFVKSDYSNVRPFNFYESPYPDIEEIHSKEAEIFNRNREVLGINFNISRQLELLAIMSNMESPLWKNEFDSKRRRYTYHNTWFCKGSADALYYMIRILKPQNIIEVGSGYSTAAMLDVNEEYFDNSIHIDSIEPYPERLKSLLRNSDNLEVSECGLQDISLSFFEKLNENDILFVDSSHVAKVNSDINYLFFEILPRLNKGVYIHFHDVFYPFIYPKQWVYEGRAYNEMYLLRAFLMDNTKYSIQLFGDMMQYMYSKKLSENIQGCGSGSLWIKKEKV